MRDCAMVVTGASDSIGAARSLSDLGAAVVVVERSAAKTSAVADKLRPDRYVADFAHLDQIRQLTRQLTARYPRIGVLINAGLIAAGTHTITGDGHERTFQVNHLTLFLLTTLLREPLTHSQARVITTASSASTSRQASEVLDDFSTRSGPTERWAPTPPASWRPCCAPENSPGAGDRPASRCRRAAGTVPLSVRRSQHAGSASGKAMTSRTGGG
jgi:NAD(P)-dependent dehydrogenase (short-subunit alcohol dehydrogenase family)